MCNYRARNGVAHTARRAAQLGWDNIVIQCIDLSGLIQLKMFPCSCSTSPIAHHLLSCARTTIGSKLCRWKDGAKKINLPTKR